MSITWSNRVWRDSAAAGARLLVLLALADNADDATGISWPSIAYLCQRTRLSDRHVQRCLRWLQRRGEVAVEARLGLASRYVLQRIPPRGDRSVGGDKSAGGDAGATQNQEEGRVAALPSRALRQNPGDQQDSTTLSPGANTEKSKPQTKAELGVAFETFWRSYPPRRARRERKAEAWAEYLKLRPLPDLQARMLVAVRLYAQGNELPVDCCRWIKRRQWEDEVEVRVAKRVPVAGTTVADLIPDEKPDRSPEAIAKVRAIRESLPWAK